MVQESVRGPKIRREVPQLRYEFCEVCGKVYPYARQEFEEPPRFKSGGKPLDMAITPRTLFTKVIRWLKLGKKENEKMPESYQDVTLSQAITKGISMRKKRATGVYFAGEDRSDTLGAAYQGLTGESDVHNYQVDGKLETAFPVLRRRVSNPETGEVATLKTVIRQLNDKHQWKRKNIARFVKAVEDRLTLQKEAA